MKEMEVVTLEDDNNYIVIDKIDNYVYLTKEEERDFFAIKKIELENDEEYFCGLDSDLEFDKALELFTNKYKDIIK